MTHEEIILAVLEVGGDWDNPAGPLPTYAEVARFADLIAKAERKWCMQQCLELEEIYTKRGDGSANGYWCATHIDSQGEKKDSGLGWPEWERHAAEVRERWNNANATDN